MHDRLSPIILSCRRAISVFIYVFKFNWFMQLKLRHKLVLFIIAGVVVSSFVGILYVQKMQGLYEQLVYQQTSEKLHLYSERIEEKLQTIDKLTEMMVSDSVIQYGLKQIKYDKDSYETFNASSALKQKLLTYPLHDYAIESVAVIDTWGKEYWAGSIANIPTPAAITEMVDLAASKEGASLWTGGGADSSTFITLRQVRVVQNMGLQPIGTLIIRVNANALINPSNQSDSQLPLLLIQDQNEPIYSNVEEVHKVELPAAFQGKSDPAEQYHMLSLASQKYLATYSTIKLTGWTFIHLVPYESLFETALATKQILLLLYGCILAALLWFAILFARSVTLPLEELTRNMTKVERGDFASQQPERVKTMDEIGLLSVNFAKMTDRLDRLIKDNYVKQIHLKESQYEALKAKLNPHFLYNTLDSINWLAKRNGQQAISRMVKALGDMLRSTISKKEMVTVREEIAHLNNYLFIQKFRFEERLRYSIDIPVELHSCYLPNMILQPIVENCIKYGMDARTGNVDISISGERFGDRIDLWIADQGPGMNVDYLSEGNTKQADGEGIGIRSIHERIQLLYGEAYGVSILEGMDQGAIVRISVPVMSEGEGS